jgi:thioredoxin-related protein
MKLRTLYIIIILLVLMFIGQFSSATAGTAGISWHPYDEGMALGKSQEKKVFINFYATWCSYCRMMDTTTFKDAAIIAYLNENFISIKVDVDKQRSVAAQYNISPLPDVWFISEKGEAIGNKPGYIPTKEMLPVLKFIQTDSYLKMSYQKFLDSQP